MTIPAVSGVLPASSNLPFPLSYSSHHVPSCPIFKTIPPERVGVMGEYDHSGLAKRVTLVFHHHFHIEELRHLHISQRGQVVILEGKFASGDLLERMIKVALSVPGASDVEVFGVNS